MRSFVIGVLCLVCPVVVLAGDGGDNPTCDACINVDGTIFPTPAWQTIGGTTAGQPNSEVAYSFCAVPGGVYTFSTCPSSSPGSAGYDSAISVWSDGGGICGVQQACNDDNCSDPAQFLSSYVTFVAGAGGNYIVVVDGFSSATGTYNLAYMGPECAPTPVGACCTSAGCAVTTASQCTGQYMGDGTDCDPDPCVVPTEKASWGKVKSTYR